MTAATNCPGILYGLNKGDTLHIFISSGGDGPLSSDGTNAFGKDRVRAEAEGVDNGGQEGMPYRDAYHRHPRLAFRRYSERSVTSSAEQTISGLGWNATWRSAHTGRPMSYAQKNIPDTKAVTSAEEALRILLGDRSTDNTDITRSGSTSPDKQVRGHGTGSFTLRSSYGTLKMDDNRADKAPIRKSLDEALKKIADSRQRLAMLINQKPDGDGEVATSAGDAFGIKNKQRRAAIGQGKRQAEKTKATHAIGTEVTCTQSKVEMEPAETKTNETGSLTADDSELPVSANAKTPSRRLPLTPGQRSSAILASRETLKQTSSSRRQYSRSGPTGENIVTGKAETKQQLIYPWKQNLKSAKGKETGDSGKRHGLKKDENASNSKLVQTRLPVRTTARTTVATSSQEEYGIKSVGSKSKGSSSDQRNDAVSDGRSPIAELPTTAPPGADQEPPGTPLSPGVLPDQQRSKGLETIAAPENETHSNVTDPDGKDVHSSTAARTSSSSSTLSSSLTEGTSAPDAPIRREDEPVSAYSHHSGINEEIDDSSAKTKIEQSRFPPKVEYSESAEASVDHPERINASTNAETRVEKQQPATPSEQPDTISVGESLTSAMTSNKRHSQDGEIAEKAKVEKKEPTWTSRLIGKLTQKWDQSKQKRSQQCSGSENVEATPSSESVEPSSSSPLSGSPAASPPPPPPPSSDSPETSSISECSGKRETKISQVDIIVVKPTEAVPPRDEFVSPVITSILASDGDQGEPKRDPDDVFTKEPDVGSVPSDNAKVQVSTFTIQVTPAATDNNSSGSRATADSHVRQAPTDNRSFTGSDDSSADGGTASCTDASTPATGSTHPETTRLDNVVVVDQADPERITDTDVELVASRPEAGAIRQRSLSTPCSTGSLAVATEHVGSTSGDDVTDDNALPERSLPETRSPLITGYSQMTSELIKAKLRENRDRFTSETTEERLGGTSHQDTIRIDVPPHLEPFMFARSRRHEISPEETLKRIEMLKRRRRYLSSGNLLDDQTDAQDDVVEIQADVSEKSGDSALTELERLKELQRQKQAQLEAMLAAKVKVETRDLNGRKGDTQTDAGDEITDDYLRNQQIERTAEKLDWFRHKRQTADTMCNAKLNRLLAGVGQRYAEHQSEVISKYISPSSRAAELILSRSGTNKSPSSGHESTFNGRRSLSMSTDRLHLHGNEEQGTNFRFYTSNPFDV